MRRATQDIPSGSGGRGLGRGLVGACRSCKSAQYCGAGCREVAARLTFRFRGGDGDEEMKGRNSAGRCCLLSPLRIPAGSRPVGVPEALLHHYEGTLLSGSGSSNSSPLSAWLSAKTPRSTDAVSTAFPTAPAWPSSPRRNSRLEAASGRNSGASPHREEARRCSTWMACSARGTQGDTGQTEHAPFATRQPRDTGSGGGHKTVFCLARGLGCGLALL